MPASTPTSPIGEIPEICSKCAPLCGAHFLFFPENRQLFIFPLTITGNCMRDCWETTTQRPSTPQPPNTQRSRDRKTGHGLVDE